MGTRDTVLAEWNEAGVDLLRIDPGRLLALLVIARRIAMAHADPMSVSLAEIVMVNPGESNGSA
jgi:hypothetical protein